MKKLVAAFIISASLLLAAPAQADQVWPAPPDNYGQCAKFLTAIGVNPSIFRPPLIGAGPNVVFVNPDDPLNPIKIVGSKAYDFGVACHYEIPE